MRQEDQPVDGNLVAVELVIQRGMCDTSTRLTLLLFKNASRSMCDISQKMPVTVDAWVCQSTTRAFYTRVVLVYNKSFACAKMAAVRV